MKRLIYSIIAYFTESSILRMINKINRKLKTKFSYYLILEELDFLKAIPLEKVNPYMKRYEHFTNVSLLWLKGLKEEYIVKYRESKAKYHSSKEIELLFNKLTDKIIKYFYYLYVFDKKEDIKQENSLKDTRYLKIFKSYDLADLDDLKNDIIFSRSILVLLKNNFLERIGFISNLSNKEINKKNIYNYVTSFLMGKYKDNDRTIENLLYFGPMTFNHSKCLINNDLNKAFKKAYKASIIHFYSLQNKRKYKNIKMNRINLYNNDYSKYRIDQIKQEKYRLDEMEKGLINNKYNDYYIDSFIWRLLNDLSYISNKYAGGIKKIIDKPGKGKIKELFKNGPVNEIGALDIDSSLFFESDYSQALMNKNLVMNNKDVQRMDKTIKEQIIIEELKKDEKKIEELYKSEPERTRTLKK